ncbi:MAG TPA: hypothetical protein VHW00_04585 [Thermoanaerobaculia bacterium]|nr:hypothetical protein [Thermoanaerobaculia bacterium]
MENRERDRVSQRTTPTEAGQINRHVEEEKGRQQNSGTSAEFGQSIGRSENLEGGTMDNNKRDGMNNSNSDLGSESSRRPGSDYNSSVGRSSGSEIQDTGKRRGSSTGEVGNSGTSGRSGNFGDSSEGRH